MLPVGRPRITFHAGYDDTVPPVSGDRLTMRPPGRTWLQAVLLWTLFYVQQALCVFAAILALGVVLYAMAITVLWLRFLR